MKRLRVIGRRVLDAALQLALPFVDASPQPRAATPPGMRQVDLSGKPIRYFFRRSARRTIGFKIDRQGLHVTAPRWVTLNTVESALQQRSNWILRKLDQWQGPADERPDAHDDWVHGSEIAILGQRLVIVVDPDHSGAPNVVDARLHLKLPVDCSTFMIREAIHGWMQTQARGYFAQRLEHYRLAHGLSPSRWRLTSARTRWGSCSSDGSIRLNWRLLHFPPDIVDYVICHELAHLRELNHGPQFWQSVAALFPQYRTARNWLRTHGQGHAEL